MLTQLLDSLDQNVVGTAMPRVIGQLQGFDRYSWTVTAYFLAMTTALPIVGKLSDQFGRKGFVVGGSALFLVGSVLCGGVHTIDQLIAFRALQGLGAGIGIGLVATVIGDLFPPAERAHWQGILAAVSGCAAIFGPTLGGVLADHGPLLSTLVTAEGRWRWVFYLNLPLGLLAIAALVGYLPAGHAIPGSLSNDRAPLSRIDLPGALLAATATLCLLVGLTLAGNDTTSLASPSVLGMMALAALLFFGFVLAERVALEPILPLGLFRNRVYAASAALSLLVMMALFGAAFYVSMFIQGVLGASPTESGATMTAFSVGIPVGAFLAGTAIGRLKRSRVVAILGTLVMTAGVLLLTLVTPTTGLALVAIDLAVAGLGMGMLFPAITVIAQNAMPATALGAGTGALRYVGLIGGLLGIAIVGSIVNQSLASELSQRLPTSAMAYVVPAGADTRTETRVLTDPAYREEQIQRAIEAAVARVPAGAQHDQTVATVTVQVQDQLRLAHEALRLSLAAAVHRGLVTVLLFCAAAIVAACFVGEDILEHEGHETV
jgi:EmrB/QacA subfamily drug resistance transporter